MRPARILVLRGGALGDFVVTLPALAALRERWPDGFIEVVGYPHVAELARQGGLADRVISLHGAGIARFFSLRPEFPDAQVEWIRSFDFILSYLHDPDGVVVDNLKRAGAHTVLQGSPLVTDGHAVDHLLKPLESLAIYARGRAPRLVLPPAPSPRALPAPYAVLHPGSGSLKKNAPLEWFLDLALRLERERAVSPVFLTGEADAEVAAQLSACAPHRTHLRDVSLMEAAHVLAGAVAYAGNDSGITHLAAALGVPTLAVFGPSDPEQWGPRGEQVRIVRAPQGDWSQLAAVAHLELRNTGIS